MGPGLEHFKLIHSCCRLLFGSFDFIGIFVHFKGALRAKLSSMSQSSQLRPQKVTLLAWERRTAVYVGIQVTGEHVFDHSGDENLLGLHVRQLNPVLQQVVSYPVDERVRAITPLFLAFLRRLFHEVLWKCAADNPVVFVDSVDFAEQFQACGTAHLRQLLHRLLQQHDLLLAEANARPFQHFSLLEQVRYVEGVIAQ